MMCPPPPAPPIFPCVCAIPVLMVRPIWTPSLLLWRWSILPLCLVHPPWRRHPLCLSPCPCPPQWCHWSPRPLRRQDGGPRYWICPPAPPALPSFPSACASPVSLHAFFPRPPPGVRPCGTLIHVGPGAHLCAPLPPPPAAACLLMWVSVRLTLFRPRPSLCQSVCHAGHLIFFRGPQGFPWFFVSPL